MGEPNVNYNSKSKREVIRARWKEGKNERDENLKEKDVRKKGKKKEKIKSGVYRN